MGKEHEKDLVFYVYITKRFSYICIYMCIYICIYIKQNHFAVHLKLTH